MNTASFQPNQRQRWDLCASFSEHVSSPTAQFELRCWSAIGLMSLGIAGFFALSLAISRIPNTETVISWPIQFFEKGLVIHVVFSFVIFQRVLVGKLDHVFGD